MADVKRDMQAALDGAYTKSDKSESEKAMQEQACGKNEIPNAEDFIRYAVGKIKAGPRNSER